MLRIPYFLVTRCLILCMTGCYLWAFPQWLNPRLLFAGPLTPWLGGLFVFTAVFRLLAGCEGRGRFLLDLLVGLEFLVMAAVSVYPAIPGGFVFAASSLTTFWALGQERVEQRCSH